MPVTKVAIRSVSLDPPATKQTGRQRYRIMLECGCSWWEDHTDAHQLPGVGDMVNCHAGHPSRAQLRGSVTTDAADELRRSAAR
jgi:hypothetical protein